MLLIFLSAHALSQTLHKNQLRLGATFSPALFKNYSIAYLHAEAEYFLENQISIRSDADLMIGSINNKKLLSNNRSICIGAAYNFLLTNQLNAFIALQPGINILKLNTLNANRQISPIASATGGLGFYPLKHLHVFLNLKFVQGIFANPKNPVFDYFECRANIGMGLQF